MLAGSSTDVTKTYLVGIQQCQPAFLRIGKDIQHITHLTYAEQHQKQNCNSYGSTRTRLKLWARQEIHRIDSDASSVIFVPVIPSAVRKKWQVAGGRGTLGRTKAFI